MSADPVVDVVASLPAQQRRAIALVLHAGLTEVGSWSRRNGLEPPEVAPALRLRDALTRPEQPEVEVKFEPISDLARDLGMAGSTLRRWCDQGEVRAEKPRGRWHAERASVAARLRSR